MIDMLMENLRVWLSDNSAGHIVYMGYCLLLAEKVDSYALIESRWLKDSFLQESPP
jgi:hypothetical protein